MRKSGVGCEWHACGDVLDIAMHSWRSSLVMTTFAAVTCALPTLISFPQAFQPLACLLAHLPYPHPCLLASSIPPSPHILLLGLQGEDDVLVYDIRCRASTRQAQELHAAITATRFKFYSEPLRATRGYKVTPVIAAEQRVGFRVK